MDIKRIGWAITVLVLVLVATAGPAAAQEQNHCGDVRRNETWQAGVTHLVCPAGVTVQRSTLTVAPGADILMGEGANLVIAEGAALVAQGTEAQGVRFRANSRDDAPGFWGQIRIERDAEESIMRRIIVQSGGRDNVPMVEVIDTVVLMDFATFRWAADVPLAFSAAALGPSLEAPGQGTAGTACQRISFTANVASFIKINGDAQADVTESATWHNFCVPYRVNEEIVVAGPDDPVLALDLGVSMHLSGEGLLQAGLDADNPGQLVTNGSPTEPVVLTAESGAAGGWKGVLLTEHGGLSSFINTRFEYGGQGGQPMVTVRSPDATALGVSFHEAAGYPLAIVPSAVASFMSSLFDIEEPVFVDNAIQRVLVLASEEPVVGRGSTWGDAGASFEIDDTMLVTGISGPRLTLDPGAQLLFRDGKRLVVGHEERGPGELVARGSEERPVVLSALNEQPGAWGGVTISDEATLATLDLATVAYGGAGGAPMLDWGRVTGDVTRTMFRGAQAYPIALPLQYAHEVILNPEVPEDAEESDLRCSFEGNGVDRVLIEVSRTYSESASEWNDPGAPVEFDDSVVVSSPSRPLLELKGDLQLMFRPNTMFDVGRGDGGRASLLVDVEDPEAQSVAFGPVDPDAGWLGIGVKGGSSLQARGLAVAGVADTGTALSVEDASATLGNVLLEGTARGTGLLVAGDEASVGVTDSRITGNRIGIHTRDGGNLSITRSIVEDNTEWGFRNEDPSLCLIANLVYWGSGSGPNDPSDAEDGCLNGANESPAGDRVSDDVDWWPYAINEDFDPSSGLGPNPKKIYCPFTATGR